MIKNDSTKHTKATTQFILGEINHPYRTEVTDIQIVKERFMDLKCNSEVFFTKKEFDFVMNNLVLFM